METQFNLRIYAVSGIVRKADAKKMSKMWYYHLRNGVVVIPVVSKEIAHLLLKHEIRTKKYLKPYKYCIEKQYFTTECKNQVIRNIRVECGNL
jgi:hypothetical protein